MVGEPGHDRTALLDEEHRHLSPPPLELAGRLQGVSPRGEGDDVEAAPVTGPDVALDGGKDVRVVVDQEEERPAGRGRRRRHQWADVIEGRGAAPSRT